MGHARHWYIMISILGGLLLQILVVFIAPCILHAVGINYKLHDDEEVDYLPTPEEKTIERVFKDRIWFRLGVLAWRMTRATVNTTYLIYACASTTPISSMIAELQQAEHGASQNSTELWCFERHMITLVEGLLSARALLLLLMFLIRIDGCQLVNSLDRACSFSAFNLLPLANPMHAAEVMQRMVERVPNIWFRLIVAVTTGIYIMCIAIPVAAMAVLVKVSKLGFIADGRAWTFYDVLACAMFINALAGLRGGVEGERQRALFMLVGKGTYQSRVHREFMNGLLSQLRYRYGEFSGLAVFATLSTTELCQLLS